MPYRLLDCYPGCGVAYAVTRAPNFTYVGRCSEPFDASAAILEANHELIGPDWDHQIEQRQHWEPQLVDVVIGAPAFKRRDFLRFAVRCEPAAIVMDIDEATWLSPAYVADIMRTLAECSGGRAYLVTFVPYDELALGAARQRRRCAVVASQVEFGVWRSAREIDWPVVPWVQVKRGRGAELTPAVRGFGPEWVWPDGPHLVGMSPWVARWVLGELAESLGARPGPERGDRRPDGARVITVVSGVRR